MNILLILNGNNIVDIKKLGLTFDYIVAVDGGYNHCIKQNIIPNEIIGDFDSINLKNNISNIRCIKLNKDKFYTDGEEALKYIINKFENINNIFIVGFSDEDRIDHLINNIFFCAKYPSKKIYLIDNKNILFFTNKSIELKYFEFIKYVSFFPITNIKNLTKQG